MLDHIFREYDIRGKVGSELKIESMYDLGRAIAYFLKQQCPTLTTIAVGMDGRLHSPALKDETIRALRDSGIHVLFLGTCPTPVMYFSQFSMPVQAGLMITASHNPPEYNGLKICLNQESVWGKQLSEIRHLYKNKMHLNATEKGMYQECDGVDAYVTYLTDHFNYLKGMDLGVVVDCANAVGGLVMPKLIHNLGWKNVKLLYAELDGMYPNHEADPVVEENMQDVRHALKTDASLELGIGLDGDCDRMAPMTKSGYLVPGDQLLALFSQYILKTNPGAAIVFDVKASGGLIELLTTWGARPCISACGHSIIKNEMKKEGAVLGGELSCHFCFKDRYFGYDDGIYAALRLLEIILVSGKKLDELIAMFPRKYASSEIRLSCDEAQKGAIVEHVKQSFAKRADVHTITIDGVRAVLPHGWGLVRASNTQAVLSFRFEAESLEGLQEIRKEFISLMMPFFNERLLQEKLQG